jgi:RNA polymerase sigma factor (sigma-70 family)
MFDVLIAGGQIIDGSGNVDFRGAIGIQGDTVHILASETHAIVQRAIAALPLAQREVIALRDIEGWPASDVCNALGLTETSQRVLLHRARSKVRAALEPYLSEEP